MKKNRKATAKDVVAAKMQEATHQLNGMQLLGEIITWSTKSEEPRKHKDVVSALSNAGLDTAIARELLPRFAFSRACKKLTEAAAIDVTKETDTEIKFQFTKKMMQQEEWVYSKDTTLTLNKTTGTVTCPKHELEATAQRLLDEAIEVRTTSDISKMVQRLFEKNGDLFPVREQGGVYFVPIQYTNFISRIEKFLSALGGRVTRFPIPAGTDHGDKAVAEAVAEHLEGLVKQHMDAIAQFTMNTRKDTIEHVAEKIKETRIKIQAYASFLKDKVDYLLEQDDVANQKLLDQVDAVAEQRESAPAGTGGLFGYSVTSVIRFLGKHGWNFRETEAALKGEGLNMANATIRTQLSWGRTGIGGDPAKVTTKQIKQLEKHTKGIEA